VEPWKPRGRGVHGWKRGEERKDVGMARITMGVRMSKRKSVKETVG